MAPGAPYFVKAVPLECDILSTSVCTTHILDAHTLLQGAFILVNAASSLPVRGKVHGDRSICDDTSGESAKRLSCRNELYLIPWLRTALGKVTVKPGIIKCTFL